MILTRRLGRQPRPVNRNTLPSGASRGSTDMQKRLQSGDCPVFVAATAVPGSKSAAASAGARIHPTALLRCDLKT